MSLIIRESNAILDEYIDNGYEELYDILQSGAEVHTNSFEYAAAIRELFPNAVVRLDNHTKRHRKKNRKNKKRH